MVPLMPQRAITDSLSVKHKNYPEIWFNFDLDAILLVLVKRYMNMQNLLARSKMFGGGSFLDPQIN